jgi:hypothetical protein
MDGHNSVLKIDRVFIVNGAVKAWCLMWKHFSTPSFWR